MIKYTILSPNGTIKNKINTSFKIGPFNYNKK